MVMVTIRNCIMGYISVLFTYLLTYFNDEATSDWIVLIAHWTTVSLSIASRLSRRLWNKCSCTCMARCGRCGRCGVSTDPCVEDLGPKYRGLTALGLKRLAAEVSWVRSACSQNLLVNIFLRSYKI